MPQGPLGQDPSSTSIVLATIVGTDMYVMCSSTSVSTGLEMIKLNVAGTDNRDPSVSPLVFTLSFTGTSYQFKTTGGGYLTYTTSGVDTGVLTIGSTPRVIFMDQNSYQPFERPSSLVSGAKYIPRGDISILTPLRVYQGSTPDVFELIPVPVNYYTDCDNVTSDVYTALKMVECSYSLLAPTSCTGLRPGWTDQVDCVNDNVYQYCPTGSYCNGNCKSQCLDPMEVCTYAGSSTYTCERPSDTVQTTQTHQSQTVQTPVSMLVIAVVVGILLIVAMFLLVYYWSKPDTSVVQYTQTSAIEPWYAY